MNFDFSEPITLYELIAVGLSILAAIVPFVRWIIKKAKKLKISFVPSGQINIYFNKSGSYVSFGGVYEAKNKAVVVDNISVEITRNKDNAILKLDWSVFPSPVVKKNGATFESSFEIAHPFKIEPNSLVPVYIEFSVKNIENEINSAVLPAINKASKDLFNLRSDEDVFLYDSVYRSSEEYKQALINISNYFFWQEGEYVLKAITKYNKNKKLIYENHFALSEIDKGKLISNIDNILIEPLARHINATININTIRSDFLN